MKPILVCLLVLHIFDASGQRDTAPGNKFIYRRIDTTVLAESKVTSNTHTYLSPVAFTKRLKLIFGQLATGQSGSANLSNYADADLANGKLGFNGVLPGNGRLMMSIAANGKLNNSVSELFDGFKINSSTSIDLGLHLRVFTKFYFSEKDRFELENKRKFLLDKKAVLYNQTDWIGKADSIYVNRLAAKRSMIFDSLDCLRKAIALSTKPNLEPCDRVAINKMREDYYRLLYEDGIAKWKQDSVNLAIHLPGRMVSLRKAMSDSITKEILKAEVEAPFESFHLGWVSFRFNPSRQKFYLYDSTLAYDQQVKDTAFTTSYVGVQFNYYYTNRNKGFSIYANAGVGHSWINNLDTLTNLAITDSRSQTAGTQNRKVENKYSAYAGQYLESSSWKYYANFYVFGAANNWAIHFFPEWIRSGSLTINNLGVGFILSFKSKKDEKTIINAEPYIQWNDTGNKLASSATSFKRNTIGIRVGLPINPPKIR